MDSSPPAPAPPERLQSIDALRGFDMFWIMGGDLVFRTAARWMPPRVAAVVNQQLEHAEWEGFFFYDLIFPLFLFLVGVVLPFSLGKLQAQGAARSGLYRRIGRRMAFLIVLGLICNGLLRFQFADLRYAGVLQRIGLCYGFAALIYVNTGRIGRGAVLAAILVGYWALLAAVPPPGGKPGDYSKEGNLVGYVDRHVLPGKIIEAYYGFGDNEGLLSTIPAIATALIGVMAGEWLRSARRPEAKVAGLLGAGLACVVAGQAWGGRLPILDTGWSDTLLHWGGLSWRLDCPIIKNIWTSSFVLLTGGWSLILLALFHWVIDVQGWRRWAFPLVVIGANAIAIFIVPRFVDFKHMTQFFLVGVLSHSGVYEPLVLAVGMLVAKWLFLLFLYRHKIYLRV